MRVLSIRKIVLAVALVATVPTWAQKQSLGDRVSRLEQQAATQNQSAGQSNVDLLNRLTQLQSEVQALRNQIEQLQNENEQLKQRSREQYVDIDTRLQRLEGGSSATNTVLPTPATVDNSSMSSTATARDRPISPGDEQTAYGMAFDALKRGDYVESARGFKSYLQDFPQGTLAPNAWYWLGESYYVTQNYQVALEAFDSLLSQFPDSSKTPDALLKIGYCQLELKQSELGQQTLNRVINNYPNTDAARLALSRLRALSIESR